MDMVYVTIAPSAIPVFTYTIGYPQVASTYTIPPFTVSPGTATAARFAVVYTLTDSAGLVPPPLASSIVSNAGNILTVQTANFNNAGTYVFGVQAAFASYNPGYSVFTTFTLTLVNPCPPNAITPSAMATAYYYMINDPPSLFNWTPWTESITICGPIVYSLSATPVGLTFDTTLYTLTLATITGTVAFNS